MLSFKRIDNLLVWGIKGAVFLIPCLPLYVTPSMAFPYITGKNFAFRILVEFAAALWLGLIVSNKEYRLRNSPITISILVFTFIIGIADLFGVSPYNSFWSNYERMEGYITILHLALYFIIIRSVLLNRKDWKIFINISFGVSAIVSIFALLAPMPASNSSQFIITYGNRIYGTIGNPPFLASYLLLSVFLGFILLLNTHRLYLKSVYLSLIIINSIAIYFSATRGAILAAFIGAIMFGLFCIMGRINVSKAKRVRIASLSMIGILIILVVTFFAFRNADFMEHDRTLSRFATMFSDASGQLRISGWKFAWEGIKTKPLLGWGQENFIGVYTVNTLPFIREQVWLDRAHNIIIEWLVNAGILGLVSYLAIFGAAFYALWMSFQRKTVSKYEGLILITAFAVYFIQNLLTFDTINTYLLFFSLLVYIDNIDYLKKTPEIKDHADEKKIKIRSLGLILPALLIFAFLFYSLHYKPIKENQLLARISDSSSNDNSYADLLTDINRVLSLNTFGDSYVRKVMRSISSAIIRTKQFTQEGSLHVIEATVKELEKGIPANHHNLQYLTDVITFYQLIAEYEPSFITKTEGLIRKSIRLNPEYQWLYMALADVYVLKKDYEGAFINVKKIADSDPQNAKKQFKLVMAAIFASRDKVALNAMENIKRIRMAANRNIASGKKTLLSADELYQLAEVYREMNNIPEALRYYKKLMYVLSYDDKRHRNRDFNFRKPEVRAKLHMESAKMYITLDDKENAIKEAKKAREIDPDNFTEEAETFIYSLNN